MQDLQRSIDLTTDQRVKHALGDAIIQKIAAQASVEGLQAHILQLEEKVRELTPEPEKEPEPAAPAARAKRKGESA